MNAIASALTGLIDYAGLYPPAALGMEQAVANYLEYVQGNRAWALGRFIVDASRLNEFEEAAANHKQQIPLSVIAANEPDWHALDAMRSRDLNVATLEVKADGLTDLVRIAQSAARRELIAYIEIPINEHGIEMIDSVAKAGARVKLRMGGVVADAFPLSEDVADTLSALAARKTSFKATAGLHHPIRSHHAFTEQPGSATGLMHGFINVLCASALVYFGGSNEEARSMLEEQDSGSFHVGTDSIAWTSHRWTSKEICEVRERSFISFGSCSFTDPIRGLETLGWL